MEGWHDLWRAELSLNEGETALRVKLEHHETRNTKTFVVQRNEVESVLVAWGLKERPSPFSADSGGPS